MQSSLLISICNEFVFFRLRYHQQSNGFDKDTVNCGSPDSKRSYLLLMIGGIVKETSNCHLKFVIVTKIAIKFLAGRRIYAKQVAC